MVKQKINPRLIGLLCLAFLFIFFSFVRLSQAAASSDLKTRLSGRILLQVENHGEAWYLEPATGALVYLSNQADTLSLLSRFGLGIAHKELKTYLKKGFPKRLSGRIMLDVQSHGEAYYVNPLNLKGYRIANSADLAGIIRSLAIGISNKNLKKISGDYEGLAPTLSTSSPILTGTSTTSNQGVTTTPIVKTIPHRLVEAFSVIVQVEGEIIAKAGDIIEKGIIWGNNDGSGLSSIYKSAGSDNSQFYKINIIGLLPGGSYFFQAYAVTKAGDFIYGNKEMLGSFNNSKKLPSLISSNVVSKTTLHYFAGANGALTGDTNQILNASENGSAVFAVADEHYHFVYWNDGLNINPRTDTGSKGDINVTAQFEIDSFNVTFDKNGGDEEAVPVNKSVNYGGSLDAMPNQPVKAGHNFITWNTAADGSGNIFDARSVVKGNVTVYAQWLLAGTCVDGIKNQDEVEVDCGGNACSACATISQDWRWPVLSVLNTSSSSDALLAGADSGDVVLAPEQSEEVVLRLDSVDNGGIFTYELDYDDIGVWEIKASQSFNSTDGVNGSWTDISTSSPDDLVGPIGRLRKIELSSGGTRWFKFSVKNKDIANRNVGSFGLRKFSNFENDYWLFTGASIEASTINYQLMNINAKNTYGYDPLIFNMGQSGKTVQWLDENIDDILVSHPRAKYVVVHTGGNNVSDSRPYATMSEYRKQSFITSYRSVINKIKAAGKIPMPARLTFRAYVNEPAGLPGTYHGGMPQYGSAPYNTEIIDPIIAEMTPDYYNNELDQGAIDLYTPFLNNQIYLQADGVHPNLEGREFLRGVWNQTVFRMAYLGLMPVPVVPGDFNTPPEDAEALIVIAENTRETVDINTAQAKLDELAEWPEFSTEEATLQIRLDAVVPTTALRYWVDFGNAPYPSSPNWANLTGIATGTTVNLVSDGGVASPIVLLVSKGFVATSNGGVNFDGLVWSAARDSFIVRGYTPGDSELTLSDLDDTKKYALSFYSTASCALGYITDFTINGTKKSVSSCDNSSSTIDFLNLIPNAEGKIIVTVGTDTSYGYLNALLIKESENPPSCDDGLLNQDEVAVDIGGVCGVARTLTYTAGSHGIVTGVSPQIINSGTNGSAVTAVPDINYHFVNWSDSSTQNPRTDLNVGADITVTANFSINTHTVIYAAGAHGSISGSSPQIINHGANSSAVTAVPDLNYVFVNWSDSSTQNPRTDLNVSSDISVSANFALAPTCSDGIQNQDETGIDCGGSTCGACSAKTFLIDFGTTLQTSGNWNNITASAASSSLLNVIDNVGGASDIDLLITTKFSSTGTTGANTLVGIYPHDVIIDNFYVSSTTAPAVVKISGLDSAKTYDFKFFGSRTGASYSTDYTINGTTVTLNCASNIDRTQSINNVSPVSNEIIFSVQASSGFSNGYLNALELTER